MDVRYHSLPYAPNGTFNFRRTPVPTPRLFSANDQFYVASSGDLKGKTGNFYVNRRVTKPPRPARNDEMCSELWGVLEKLSGLSY